MNDTLGILSVSVFWHSYWFFIADNLPNKLEVKGLKIKLDLRKPKSNELGLCSYMGPTYTWLFIIKAEKMFP